MKMGTNWVDEMPELEEKTLIPEDWEAVDDCDEYTEYKTRTRKNIFAMEEK
jgi:hypothetical protein